MDTSLEYLSGFFDGEGCIDIHYGGGGKNKGRYYQLRVRVSQVNPSPLMKFKNRFGGTVILEIRGGTGTNHKPLWTWQITSRLAYETLTQLLPFLDVKKDEALMGIEFQERLSGSRGIKLTPEEESSRMDYHMNMKALKKRTFETILD